MNGTGNDFGDNNSDDDDGVDDNCGGGEGGVDERRIASWRAHKCRYIELPSFLFWFLK